MRFILKPISEGQPSIIIVSVEQVHERTMRRQ